MSLPMSQLGSRPTFIGQRFFLLTPRHLGYPHMLHQKVRLASSQPDKTQFSAPSRPRPIHPRPTSGRDLPPSNKSRAAWLFAAALLGFSGWGAFLLYATNLERLSSSVTRQVISNLKQNSDVQRALGAPIRLPSAMFLSDPWISGAVNMPAGHVDLSFRIQGSRKGGTVYFTSVRKEKGVPFTILRFKVITDDGETISLTHEPLGQP
ncbi:SubName: Full=Uncharacterized protein {ECO:0000313/EMBL:CCA67759.1} [Serendipita indica DSM 11827]|uniref:DUF1783-domain-containing protein n=1 Tax=Serendipita indica (strain DSM 11827) TaxID=1109443 RepID=G4T8Y3_SERID|nr:SubName: Full=Uncharacterized protein {ECO:0000313/EMBL:CCA67759.1} [Serendipita indica DSM 11827]CCA67759.1 hypothetical protein PIIN_01583 [Serendipita indica DSM 11827]